jgi:hypothetical protein
MSKIIGAMKRQKPGGFSASKRRTSRTGFDCARETREAANVALARLTNKGGLIK